MVPDADATEDCVLLFQCSAQSMQAGRPAIQQVDIMMEHALLATMLLML